jgi:hypothetical protein
MRCKAQGCDPGSRKLARACRPPTSHPGVTLWAPEAAARSRSHRIRRRASVLGRRSRWYAPVCRLTAGLLLAAGCAAPLWTHAQADETKGVGEAKMPTRSLNVEAVDGLLWRAGSGATFAQTSEAERLALGRIVTEVITAARLAAPPHLETWDADARAAGFRLEPWEVAGSRYIAILERAERRRGAGAYVVWIGPKQPTEIILEAPHADYDTGTGAIAARLFFAPQEGAPKARALFTNSIHRYQLGPGTRVKSKDSPADVAHNPLHAFTAATEAAAAALGRVLVLQLHGFAGNDDEGAAVPAGTRVVVSAGVATASSSRSTAIAIALSRVLGPGVRRFPEECSVLGATTNVQGRALRCHPGAEFVHLEMSPDVREVLRGDAAIRADFWQALVESKGQ